MKRYVKILQKFSNSNKYVVQNLVWSGVYMMSTFSNALLQKVLTLVLLKAIVSEVYVVTMTIFISDSYDALEETLTHMKMIKLNSVMLHIAAL